MVNADLAIRFSGRGSSPSRSLPFNRKHNRFHRGALADGGFKFSKTAHDAHRWESKLFLWLPRTSPNPEPIQSGAPAPLISQSSTRRTRSGRRERQALTKHAVDARFGLKTLTSLALTISSMSAPMPVLVDRRLQHFRCAVPDRDRQPTCLEARRVLAARPETQPGAGTHHQAPPRVVWSVSMRRSPRRPGHRS